MKPILFNTEMVRAILDGRKTVTRRINKDGSEYSVPDMTFFNPDSRTYGIKNYADKALTQQCSLVEAAVPICPGDILWVRETWKQATMGTAGPGLIDLFLYKADEPQDTSGMMVEGRWHPSIHMPKNAARIFLRVKNVRVERLQDMSAQDSLDEGVKLSLSGIVNNGESPLLPFSRLWNSTIKVSDLSRYGWDANPWVWVIEFERCEKQEVDP